MARSDELCEFVFEISNGEARLAFGNYLEALGRKPLLVLGETARHFLIE